MANKTRYVIAGLAASASVIASIAAFEGFRGEAYPDPVYGWAIPTIGHGTTSGVQRGDTITQEEAGERLRQDIARFEGEIRQCVTAPLTQEEYDAYVSLAYNIGTTKFCRSTLVRKLNALDYEGACKAILDWKYAGGEDCSAPGNRTCRGLWTRRQAEYQRCIGNTKDEP